MGVKLTATKFFVRYSVILILMLYWRRVVSLETANSSTASATQPTLSTEFKRVCRGSDRGLGHSDGHFHEYKTRYTNCTYVDGNLEIVFVNDPDFDLSFLSSIREVTGYVLFVSNYISYLPLTNLRIIRGRNLFEYDGRYYSLYIALNYRSAVPGVGLKELRLVSLHEILAGSVLFLDNADLCFEETIAWKDILTGEGAQVVYKAQGNKTSIAQKRATCGACHSSCYVKDQPHCWGSGLEYCQKLTKLSCSPQCEGRCFGPLPNQCCHSECAGGCTGPSKSQCWACKNFDNDDMCENFCPPEYIYSPVYYKQVLNPRAKLSFGSLCVDKCPLNLMADRGSCVKDCGAGRIASKDHICTECDGPCPKTCQFPYDIVDAHNIHNLTGCTIVQGHIKILDVSLKGDEYWDIPPMPVSALSALENIREVTNYVQIQANHPRFRSLSFLKKLEVIHGRVLPGSQTALQVFQTSLEMLELVSLRAVGYGIIYIANNSRLCYVSSINWDSLRADVKQKIIVTHNRNATSCVNDNDVCSPECSDSGCWGPSDEHCVSCRNYHYGRKCVNRCEDVPGVFTVEPNECRQCHPECKNSCQKEGADSCDSCRNAKDGPYCVSVCPDSKYRDENGVCQACDPNCAAGAGCTGPRNSIGEGACNSCALVMLDDSQSNVTRCLPPDAVCEDGYYRHNYAKLPGVQACYRCYPECRTCIGQGPSFCSSCVNYVQDGRCVRECSSDYYVVTSSNEEASVCQRCDPRCLSCTGPSSSDCLSCKHYKVYMDGKNGETDRQFNCSEQCPSYAPHKMTIEVDGKTENICVSEDSFEKTKKGIIIGTVFGILALLIIAAVAVTIFCVQRQRAERAKLKLTRQMTGVDETLPLAQTDAKPDMSVLTLIKESELHRGDILGSGAFGTVYRGCWIPDHGEKTPVAIKVLSEGTSPSQNKELLEEARIMASVEHPCCVKIRAICMTAQIMLVSELMPLGCLLDFVRTYENRLSSATLLLWSKQIAQGMMHLELKGIVHRDLAARNVLVQNTQQVKITDFGLAKLLEYNEEQFFSSGGKMPIKWLALECIQHRKFTHKSDVWSFGVTLWELYTYGKKPYDNIRAVELPELLEKGERLPQPPICTIDVWMLMVKCWDVDAEVRPSFGYLAEEFEKMQRDPKRYLLVVEDNRMNESANLAMQGNGSRPLSVAERYLLPKPRALQPDSGASHKMLEDDSDDVFGNGVGATAPQPRSHGDRQRQRSTSGNQNAAAANPVRTSLRYCSEPSVLDAASNGGANGNLQSDADYMQPIETSREQKYLDCVHSRKANPEVIDEEGDCDDDGFGSEKRESREYYNSLERLNPENMPLKNIPAASSAVKRPPLRGNSESIGSLETDAAESEADDSDNDYYNVLPAPKSPPVSLNLKSGGAAYWPASVDHIV